MATKKKGAKRAKKTTTKKAPAKRKTPAKKAPRKAAGKKKGGGGRGAKRPSKAAVGASREDATPAAEHQVKAGHCRFVACDKKTPLRGGVEGWRVGNKSGKDDSTGKCPWTCPHCFRCQYCGCQFEERDGSLVEAA